MDYKVISMYYFTLAFKRIFFILSGGGGNAWFRQLKILAMCPSQNIENEKLVSFQFYLYKIHTALGMICFSSSPVTSSYTWGLLQILIVHNEFLVTKSVFEIHSGHQVLPVI